LSPVLAKVIITSSLLEKDVAEPDILEHGTLKYPVASVIAPSMVKIAKSSAFNLLEILK
jgi:hypothetical protein